MRRFDIGVGLHGDHIGGERAAARALATGEVDAACMIDSNLLLFAREGVLPAGQTRIIAQTEPYDHCTMTAGPAADLDLVARFQQLLLGMSYADPQLTGRCWSWRDSRNGRPARLSGYEASLSARSRRPGSTTPREILVPAPAELDRLGLDGGGHLIVARALAPLRPGDRLVVASTHPALRVQRDGLVPRAGLHGYTGRRSARCLRR